MLVTYPALFYFDDSDISGANFFVHFPDFNSTGTQGSDISDAMMNASDYLGIIVASAIENSNPLPTPSLIQKLSLVENNPFKNEPDFKMTYDENKSFISMVTVDISKYLGQDEPIKKTLTIPKWADKLGKELHLNFSKTLTDAIADKKLNV